MAVQIQTRYLAAQPSKKNIQLSLEKSLGKNCSTNVQPATGQEIMNEKSARNQGILTLTTNFLSLLMCVKSDAGEFREHVPRPPG